MQRLKGILFTTCMAATIAACNNSANKPADTLTNGSITISADETYAPVMAEELKVFDSSYPDAHITVNYKPEAECFKDFFDNKAHLIIVTRPLTNDEKALCDQKQIAPTELAIAKDAIAVILNPSSADSNLDVLEIKGILTGTYKKQYTVVFGNQQSSAVTYILDSLLHGQKISKNVFAVKTDKDVVDYVAKNPNAIGFVGVSYVRDTSDTTNTGKFINTVRVAALQNDSTKQFYQPYLAFIADNSYPFTRKLYYINRDSYLGLARGLANFLSQERGQLIFYHAQLFPLRENVIIRSAEINQ